MQVDIGRLIGVFVRVCEFMIPYRVYECLMDVCLALVCTNSIIMCIVRPLSDPWGGGVFSSSDNVVDRIPYGMSRVRYFLQVRVKILLLSRHQDQDQCYFWNIHTETKQRVPSIPSSQIGVFNMKTDWICCS